jgi:UDP:flavonoid glycosyltransferase YjiC (YdhE family)
VAKFLWACFDGGGNVPPSLGISAALAENGHEVVFACRPEMADRYRLVGARAVAITSAYADAAAYAWHPRGRVYSYLTSGTVADELLSIAAVERPDVVIIDAMFGTALAAADRFGTPTAGMLHTFLHRTLDGWYILMRDQSEARQRCGFGPLPELDELWGTRDLFQVNALEQFDCAARVRWANVRYGGPVLERDSVAVPVRLPWPEDQVPLVVVSFSTSATQGSVSKLQRTLDALAGLPVHVAATTGAVDPASLRAPENAHVMRFAAHDPLISKASLVVTHGGHGTVMRALRHGVSLVCLTGRAADQDGVAALDQPCIAAFIEERGVGLRLRANAPAATIRSAVLEVLSDPAFRSATLGARESLRSVQPAVLAAQRLEALLPAGQPRGAHPLGGPDRPEALIERQATCSTAR